MIDIERIRKATARIRSMRSSEDLVVKVSEECAELILEIARVNTGRASAESVALEAIDCIVVSVSLIDMLTHQLGGSSAVERLVEQKMQQIERYKGEKA